MRVLQTISELVAFHAPVQSTYINFEISRIDFGFCHQVLCDDFVSAIELADCSEADLTKTSQNFKKKLLKFVKTKFCKNPPPLKQGESIWPSKVSQFNEDFWRNAYLRTKCVHPVFFKRHFHCQNSKLVTRFVFYSHQLFTKAQNGGEKVFCDQFSAVILCFVINVCGKRFFGKVLAFWFF